MSDREQFTFYKSFREALKRIKKPSDRAAAYDIICDFALYGEEPDLEKVADSVAVAFINAKPNLIASRRKAESGKKGGGSKQTGSKPEANASKPEANASKPKNCASEKEGEKEKEKEKEYECTPPTPSAEIPKAPMSCFDIFWERYPNNRGGRDSAMAAWKTVEPDIQTVRQIMTALELFRQSEGWKEKDGKYIPGAAKFLEERHWEKPPVLSIGHTGRREMDEDELAAVRRIMQEDENADA